MRPQARWQNLQDKILEMLSLPACPVWQFMPLIGLLTATEKQVHLGRLHMRPIQWHPKQWEGTGITREGDAHSQVPAPPFTMVAERRQCSHRPTITPNKTCSANLYRRIKRRMGRSLKQAHCKRNLVPSGKQTAYKLSRSQSSFSSLKRVPRPLLRQDSTCSKGQHHSGVIHKQGRRHEVRPTLCPTMENLDLVYQKSSNSQSLPHSRMAERSSRQAIQTRPDHPNRVVSPSRGLPNNMQQVAPAKNRPFCHEVQQQVASVCVTGTRSPGQSSGCTQSAMGGFGRICLPTSSYPGLGKMYSYSYS